MLKAKLMALLTFTLMLSACASLGPQLKQPDVQVTGFKVLPSNGISLRFEIDLHVTNPNDIDLDLRGVAYTVTLADHDIINGVANKLPVIEAYGEGDISLTANASMFKSMALIADVMQTKQTSFDYNIEVRLDVGALMPDVVINESGNIGLPGVNR